MLATPSKKFRWIPGTEGDIEGLVSPMMRDWNFDRFSPLRLEDNAVFGGRIPFSTGGSPVDLFHGTGDVFNDPDVFRPLLQMKHRVTNQGIPGGRSLFATNASEIADSHAGKLWRPTPRDDYAPRTYPLHVSASNPVLYDPAVQLGHQGAEVSSTVRLITKDGRMVEMPRELYHFDNLVDEGYDAVMQPMMRSGDQTNPPFEIIVPDPAQLKSATGNRGTYSFIDPNITRGVGGMVGAGSLYKLYGEE